MTDSNRRSTMQPSSDPYSRSGIPQPSTVKKPTQTNPRMSIAGPALRAPYLAPPTVPGTNPRQSMMRSQNTNALLQSTSKAYGKTPVSNNRRGSVWGGMVAPPASGQALKDSRPLRDRAYQLEMKKDIANYLQSLSFDITVNTLNSVTGKDFRTIFNILVEQLDPNHPLGQGKLEDDFTPALKALKYPFAGQMDNKWLVTPASPHTWPALLGALHWLVELCKMRDYYLQSGHPSLQVVAAIPPEFDELADHDALAFEFYESTYNLWLDHVDDLSEPKQSVEEKYDKKNETIQADLDEQNRKLTEVQAEIKSLSTQTNQLALLEKQNQDLKRDTASLQDNLQKNEAKKQGRLQVIGQLHASIAHEESELQRLRDEQERTEKVVEEQNISADEAHRMTSQHDALVRSVEDLKHKVDENNSVLNSLEIKFSNAVTAADEALETYLDLVTTLGLSPPLPPPLEDVDLTLELNSAAADARGLLLGPDINTVVRSALSQIVRMKQTERSGIEEERLRVEEEWDKLSAECTNLEEALEMLKKQAQNFNNEAEAIRERTQDEAADASAKAMELERGIATAKTAATASGVGVKTRLQALQIQYQEQVEKVNKLRNETINAIVKNSHDIALFKEEVSQQLAVVRAAAESS